MTITTYGGLPAGHPDEQLIYTLCRAIRDRERKVVNASFVREDAAFRALSQRLADLKREVTSLQQEVSVLRATETIATALTRFGDLSAVGFMELGKALTDKDTRIAELQAATTADGAIFATIRLVRRVVDSYTMNLAEARWVWDQATAFLNEDRITERLHRDIQRNHGYFASHREISAIVTAARVTHYG